MVVEVMQAWSLTPPDDANRSQQSRVAGVGPPDRNNRDGVEKDVPNQVSANARASQTQELRSVFLEHANALVENHEACETGEDIGNALQRIFPKQSPLFDKARHLHEKLVDAEAPRVSIEIVRDARRNLYQILKRLCRGRDIPTLRRKMRTFAYIKAAEGLKLLNEDQLSEETQAALLDGALGYTTAGEGDDWVWEDIRDTQIKPCLNQDVNKKSEKSAREGKAASLRPREGRYLCKFRDILVLEGSF